MAEVHDPLNSFPIEPEDEEQEAEPGEDLDEEI
jgi:hypothetical protein